MRISDWSSDVCSSDLQRQRNQDDGQSECASDHRREVITHCHWPAACRSSARACVQHRHDQVNCAGSGGSPCPGGREPLFPRQDILRSEEHTSELQSLMRISYAVFCLKKKTPKQLYQISK